jgi:hypothetical protein
MPQNSGDDLGLTVMHVLGTCVLVMGFAAFVIIAFLRVARDLLSRSIFDGPSVSHEDRVVETAEQRFSNSVINLRANYIDRSDVSVSGIDRKVSPSHHPEESAI